MNRSDPSEKRTALVVEDSRVQASILSQKLLEAGYDVTLAEDGQVALERIAEQRPTVIISDIEMPRMDGYELCRAVKRDAELCRIPFILLSTLSEAHDIIKGLDCGADNYVTKPYDPAYLISRVNSLLETPLDDDTEAAELHVTLDGVQYAVKAGRQQTLNLLISTFENAVEKNQELLRINQELTVAQEQLTRWNRDLESLNSQLETANSRMTRDLQAAARVQQSLLPSSDQALPQVQLAWKYLPCDELAGDFLNYFFLDDQHLALYVVDVSGHGVASSLLSVTIGRLLTPQATADSLLTRLGETDTRRIVSPAEVARQLNRRFPMEEQNDLFFTILYGILDLESREFRYVSAGHDPLVHVPYRDAPRLIEGSNMAIGWDEDAEYDERVVKLARGDRLYLYSDGVPEALNNELDQFTMQQMLEIIELGKSRDLRASVGLLLTSVQRWCTATGPRDDVSILALEFSRDDA